MHLLRTREVAERLGMHPETIRRHSEELGAIVVNARVHRYPLDKVEAWVAQRSIKAVQS